jgi:DNA helicase-2/ATP-dependent DNA helicase PcrA
MTRLTLAGPGAGKTQDLTDQINARLKAGMNPYSILAITFSRRAAGVITERTRSRVEGHTFHGFANWLIRLGCSIRGTDPPEIIVDREQDDLIKRAIEDVDHGFLELEEVKHAMNRIRVLNVPREAIRPQVVEAVDRYLDLLDERKQVDFTRILERGAQELQNPRVREQITSLYKAVYIDEGQDCNPHLEFPLMEPFLDVLDLYSSPSQQIYTFRGADWVGLSNLLPQGMSVRTLSNNYRSTPEIVHSSRHLAGPDATGMVSTRDSLGIPVTIYKSPRDSINLTVHTLSAIIKEWDQKGIGPENIAVLTRSSNNAKIRRGLTHYGVPLALGSFFASEVVSGALSHLWLALYPTDLQALDSAMSFPGPSLGMRTRSLIGSERVSWDELAWLISDKQFAVREQKKAIRMFQRHAHNQHILRKYGGEGRLDEAVNQILVPLRDTLLNEGWFSAASDIDQIVALSREFDTLPKFADYYREEVESVKYTEEGVTVMTIHKSKGTEFQGVIIPGWIEGRIPVVSDDPQTEQNLAYVGMTRAKDRLALMVPGSPPSPYLRGMRETSVIHV